MERPKRKCTRLPDYDYSQNGMYFVTICTQSRKRILSEIVGRDDLGTPCVECRMLPRGKIVERYILSISEAYTGVSVEAYCIMPNHVHLLLRFQNDEERRAGSSRPTQLLPRIIAVLKRFSNRDAGEKLWQTGYYEHIIRDENDFLARWQYIDQNPGRWAEDEYYGGRKVIAVQKFKCLRCDVPMEFVKRENVQLGKTTFLSGDWNNLWAGALDVAIFTCPECGKLELFQGDYYEERDEQVEESGIAKTTCPTCGLQHELDDPKCPRCGAQNPKW